MGCEANPGGFVSDLCVALAHRWEPERLFMILTIYLDESGTHDQAAVMTMGALMANALQWSRFETRLAAIQKRHGFKVFHTKKFTQGNGDFKGWSETRRQNLLMDLALLTRESGLMDSITAAVEKAAYQTEYRAGDWPRGLQPDTQYGLCFRVCLEHLLLEAARRCRKPPQINVVLELGAPNSGDCQRIFAELKKEWPVLKAMSLATKEECPPLWFGDVLATTTYRAQRDGVGLPVESYTPGKNSVMHKTFPDGALARTRSISIENYLARKPSLRRQPS